MWNIIIGFAVGSAIGKEVKESRERQEAIRDSLHRIETQKSNQEVSSEDASRRKRLREAGLPTRNEIGGNRRKVQQNIARIEAKKEKERTDEAVQSYFRNIKSESPPAGRDNGRWLLSLVLFSLYFISITMFSVAVLGVLGIL